MRTLVAFTLVFAITGCGGVGGGDSYTAKALAEFRGGSGADDFEKKKRPPAKEVAAIQKRIKNYPAGGTKDMYQALWILSNQREHEELHFYTIATSLFVRDAYKRVFGPPEGLNDKVVPNTWSHQCSDGRITLRGYWKLDGQPGFLSTLPMKQGKKN